MNLKKGTNNMDIKKLKSENITHEEHLNNVLQDEEYQKMYLNSAIQEFIIDGDYDLFFIGGGQDFEQEVLLEDLRSGKGDDIKKAVEDGKTFLCICGGYQMMGHYYETHEGVKCEFLGAVDFHTIGGKERMIDNYAFELGEESGGSIVVGYENHSGRTYIVSYSILK